MNWEFVNKTSAKVTDIGYGLRPTNPLQQRPRTRTGRLRPMSFDGLRQVRGGLRLESVSKLSGVPRTSSKAGPRSGTDPKKVVSYWTMGFNQHTRGVWANNLCYNIHLLTGKISQPGSGPSP